MFRVIGGAVVYGLALYGAVTLFDRKTAAVTQPGGRQDDDKQCGAAVGVASDPNGTSTPGKRSEASAQSSSKGSA